MDEGGIMNAGVRYNFNARVRVLSSPIPEVQPGDLGEVVGIGEPRSVDGRRQYGVMLDRYQRVVAFEEDDLTLIEP
jgi:hypothetical protein